MNPVQQTPASDIVKVEGNAVNWRYAHKQGKEAFISAQVNDPELWANHGPEGKQELAEKMWEQILDKAAKAAEKESTSTTSAQPASATNGQAVTQAASEAEPASATQQGAAPATPSGTKTAK